MIVPFDVYGMAFAYYSVTYSFVFSLSVAVYLICELPECYPGAQPIVDIEVIKGLGKKQLEELKQV
jgi:hypothetical protein